MASQPEQPESSREARDGPREPKRGRNYATTVVRYGAMNWVGEFTYRPDALSRCGAAVVAQTDRGIELGYQLDLCCEQHPLCVSRAQSQSYVDASGPEFCRPNSGRILREATEQDIDEHRRLNAHVGEDIDQCAKAAAEFRLDLKVVTAEHLLGGERIVFYFRSEGRIDFRDLVKELAHRYRTRIEMRQVGARDEARLVADWEVCGRECCCKNFLKTLRPVNMKMAKLQKSTLDPAKVSGRCGRLRCCLRYEHEGYQELAARMPRRGSRVRTEQGEGTVVDHQILTQLVAIRGDDEKEFVVPLEEITAFNLPKPPLPERAPDAPPTREGERSSGPGSDPMRRRPRGVREGRPPERGQPPRGQFVEQADAPAAIEPDAPKAGPSETPADSGIAQTPVLPEAPGDAPPASTPPEAPAGEVRPPEATGGGRRRGRRRRRSRGRFPENPPPTG